MVASIDAQVTDIAVISALPPKAALHARYLLKLIQARCADLKIIVGLWTNNKATAVDLNNVQTATTLDALQDQLDEITPMILLSNASMPARGTDETIASAQQ
jgi:hypothetical protein